MRYPAYSKYKESDEVQWLGNVPEHWDLKRSDGIIVSDRNQVQPDVFRDEEVFHYSIPAVQEHGTGLLEDGETIASAKQSITEQCLLVSKLNPRKATICIAEPKEKRTLCSTEFVVLKARKCSLQFLNYFTQSELFRQGLDSRVQSVTRSHQRAAPEDIYKFWAAWPTFEEQTAIADFLDRETDQIDTLVAKKRRLIALLKEKRTALISRTVTRGLTEEAAREFGLEPHTRFKDSGIEWLGEVPEGWDVIKVKYVAKMESGHTPSRSVPENWIDDECNIPWVSLNDTKYLKDNDYICDTAVKISAEGMSNSSAHLIPAGAVVFTRDATIGLTAITTCEAAVSQHIIAWVPKAKISAQYLLLSFKSMQQYLDSLTFGSTLKTIGMPDVRRLITPVPPVTEQTAIATYLDRETVKIERLVEKVEAAIARLQEYRTALITAAVTGKIDVREAAA